MVCFKKSVIALFLAATLTGAAEDKAFSYTPQLHGVVRARWELNTNSGTQRFLVRNARLSIGGKIHPSISYFFQTEYDNSMMQILDAYGRFDIIKGLYVQAGQFRMPFGVEPFRAPINYIFANRSFMGKQVMNYRAVGAKVGYAIPNSPFTLEFGVFNPYTIKSKQQWGKDVAYAGKVNVKLPQGFELDAGYASIKPNNSSLRANLVDGALSWENDNVLAAAEYMLKNYCGGHKKSTHAYVAYVDWHKKVKWGAFNRWSIQGRFDGMTDHYNLDKEELQLQEGRKRATVGTTFTCSYKAVHADVRVNYEKYFDYEEGGYSPDQLVLETVFRF